MAVPTQEQLDKAWAFEAACKPHAEKLCRQYTRGLLTLWELIEQLTLVDLEVRQAEPSATNSS